MKTFKPFIATMVALFSLVTFASCSDDKDEPQSTPAAKNVAGTYKGDMTCSVMGQESTFENMTFTVTATDETTVSVQISDFGEAPMKVPSITVGGVKVSGTNGSYALASTSFSGEMPNGKTYSGTLDGSYGADKITIRFNLQYGSMPMPMICSFTAPKQ